MSTDVQHRCWQSNSGPLKTICTLNLRTIFLACGHSFFAEFYSLALKCSIRHGNVELLGAPNHSTFKLVYDKRQLQILERFLPPCLFFQYELLKLPLFFRDAHFLCVDFNNLVIFCSLFTQVPAIQLTRKSTLLYNLSQRQSHVYFQLNYIQKNKG